MTLIRRTNKVFFSHVLFLVVATSNKDEVTGTYAIGREGLFPSHLQVSFSTKYARCVVYVH
jgi:hypothetical protein